MEMHVDHQKKIVEVWLTTREQQDAALMEGLRAQYRQYGEKKYTVAVFCSGRRALTGLTEKLLLHNRTAAARKDLERDSLCVCPPLLPPLPYDTMLSTNIVLRGENIDRNL